MTAQEKLLIKNLEGKFICVGLDTDQSKIPQHLQSNLNPVFVFNKEIIDATKNYAAAYKINFAFYEKDGAKGIEELEKTVSLIPEDIISIADAKKGDIGNTSTLYAKSIFNHFSFDSVTLNPYMGKDSLDPFLDYKDKINFILVLTSNTGASDFEKLELKDGRFVYQRILEKINEWNKKNNCGIVFGATKLEELKNNIKKFDNLSVLLPGVGAQGGSLEGVVSIFKSEKRNNYLINSSRGIIYKSSGKDFAEAAHSEIKLLTEKVNKVQS